MALSKTLILNKALTLIGSSPVTNINDSSAQAQALRQVYEISLKSILSECKWNFATKRLLLSQSADTLSWYDSNENIVYVRPADIIYIFGTNDSTARWRDEGDYIISDTSGLGIRYVYYHDDATKYAPLFVDAFTDLLAANIAFTVVNSASLGDKFLQKYERVSLPKATALNSQQGIQQETNDGAWVDAKSFDNPLNS